MSNVDVCFIVIAPEPAPDFLLVDKVIVNCLMEGITPVLVKNKCDTAVVDTSEYENVVKVIECSAQTGENVSLLVDEARGKTACLQGSLRLAKAVFSMRFSTATSLKWASLHAR